MRVSGRRARARRGEGELLKQEIVDATIKLLLETKDFDAVSIRAVADAVGVTPPSIYIHFASKEELVMHVTEMHFLALGEVTRAATAGIDDPVDRVRAMGRAFVDFGLQHQEQYRVLFMTRTPQWQADHIRERIMDLSGFGQVVEAAKVCIESGAFAKAEPFFVACQLLMGVHGITSILISKPVFPWPDLDTLIDAQIDLLITGLST